MSLAMRLRSCSAKCGVEAPISWRTSSIVTAWPGRSRSGCSAWLIGLRGVQVTRQLLGRDLQQRVDARLRGDRDRVRATDDPAVVVDARDGIGAVRGLGVEQLALQRLRQAHGVVEQEQ